jgi:uncharacterized protein YdeI (YjbR/CyaY-like superfamily)
MPAKPQPPLLEVGSRAELRAWLAENHASSPGVLLAIGKKGNTVTTLTYDDAVEEGLCFGWIDSTARKLDEHRYTALFTPRRPGGTWAKTNKARVERLAAEGLMTPAGFAVIEAAKTDGSWDLLTDAESLVIPSDLAAALAAAHAAGSFDALPVSQRQMALYWIASAKRPETRAKRIAATVETAVDNRGPVS